MKLFRQIKNFCFNPRIRHSYLSALGFYNRMSDEKYLKKTFELNMGYPLNLDNPQTFNEKLQWLKLHDRKPIYTTMVDKYEAKKYVASIIGEQYIIPTLGVWDDPNEIDFDALPEQFVLKCTHNSGRGMYICKQKSKLTPKDIKKIRKDLAKGLAEDFYLVNREWPYKNVKPRIIAEKFLIDSRLNELRDYKFFAFDGVARALYITTNREHDRRTDFYDMNFRHLEIRDDDLNAVVPPQKPETFEEMRRIAEILSKDIPELRVDFYEVNGKAYVGELTLYYSGGFVPFEPKEWDKKFGDWVKLPNGGGTC